MWAVDEARRRQAALDVVHAWHYPLFGPPPDLSRLGGSLPDTSRLERSARDVLETAVARTDTRGLDRPPEMIVVCGGAANTILDAAKSADLVVVGARGVGAFERLALGSVGQQVAAHADCTVLVVPPAT